VPWLLSAVLLVLVAACATNPVTGKLQLSLLSEDQEIQMGRQAAREVEQSIGLVDEPSLQAYVQRIGAALAADSERPHLPWSFAVVDDGTPNAFALPGGFIFVTRGMMNLMDSEAELASVLGHEIGHVTAKHSVTQISRQQLAQLGLGLSGVLFPEIQPFGQALGAGLQLLFLKHGRDAERQADDLGFRYARGEGYDVTEMADVFAALQRIGERQERSALPSWLATHPAPDERIKAVRERLTSAGRATGVGRLGRPEYLEQIDGLVYGENPRHGFFKDTLFLHPDLRFRVALPSGWQTANLPRAVLAVSPRQDAVAQLTLAGELPPEEASRRVLGQQGVEALRSRRESINGLPAVVTMFRAMTEQGQVAGYLAHVQHGGRTYQLLQYTGVGGFERYREAFEQTIRSFGPETDPAVLNVEPRRVDIVRLERGEPLSAFDKSSPSSVPLDVLAILNQVPAPTTPLQAGTLVKRIVGEPPPAAGPSTVRRRPPGGGN